MTRETFEKTQQFVEEISRRIVEWRIFARILGLDESSIFVIEKKFPSPDLHIQRNLEVMKQFCFPYPPTTSWEFWRQYLNKFEGGKNVIVEMEMNFVHLLAEVSNPGAHKINNDNFNYFGHPFQYKHWDSFDTDSFNTVVPVRLANKVVVDYQSISEWMDTQQQYSERYTVLKEINSFNYVNIGSPILNTLTNHLNNTNDSGFVVKGYHFVDHICLFKPGLFAKDIFDDHYFCFLANDGVVLYITECSQGKGRALYHSTRNVQIANLLHKELNSNEILQINVIVYNDDDEDEFCKSCIQNLLYAQKEIFHNHEKFLVWYKNVLDIIKLNHKSRADTASINMKSICQSIKKDMFTYEALENTNLPSFSYSAEDQIEELKKMIVLTPPQVKALNSNENHIFLRGPYGCGKSAVLEKRLERIIIQIDSEAVFYLIVHDQQSEFHHHLTRLQVKYREKNIVVCKSEDIVPASSIPKLSTILRNLKANWQNRNIHIFIDEFNGCYIDKNEVSNLQEVLQLYLDSHIVVALQSMEENLVNKSEDTIDIGYQFDFLTENTPFVIYNFKHCLRSSYEINEFVKSTSLAIECSDNTLSSHKYYLGNRKYIDKEFGLEHSKPNERKGNSKKFKTKYSFNQSYDIAHRVYSGPVKVYFLNKSEIAKINDKFKMYISVLSYLLNDVSRINQFVICTYDSNIYETLFAFFERSMYKWTNKISEFVENSHYDVLLTDYATARGYEFPNFVFIAPIGLKFLKYRIPECLARATNNLFIITDNAKTSDKVFAKSILKTWRKLDCTMFYDVKYDKSRDSLKFIEYGEPVLLKEFVNEVVIGSIKSFPWTDVAILESSDNKNEDSQK